MAGRHGQQRRAGVLAGLPEPGRRGSEQWASRPIRRVVLCTGLTGPPARRSGPPVANSQLTAPARHPAARPTPSHPARPRPSQRKADVSVTGLACLLIGPAPRRGLALPLPPLAAPLLAPHRTTPCPTRAPYEGALRPAAGSVSHVPARPGTLQSATPPVRTPGSRVSAPRCRRPYARPAQDEPGHCCPRRQEAAPGEARSPAGPPVSRERPQSDHRVAGPGPPAAPWSRRQAGRGRGYPWQARFPARTFPAWCDSCGPGRLTRRGSPGCWRVPIGTILSGRG